MELNLKTLKEILNDIQKSNCPLENVIVMLEIEGEVTSSIFRVGYEKVYDPDGHLNTGILKIDGTKQ